MNTITHILLTGAFFTIAALPSLTAQTFSTSTPSTGTTTQGTQGSTIITNYTTPSATTTTPAEGVHGGLTTTPYNPSSQYLGKPLDQSVQTASPATTSYPLTQQPITQNPAATAQYPGAAIQPTGAVPNATYPTGVYPGTTVPNTILQTSGRPQAVTLPRFEEPAYGYPGLVTRVRDRWIGSDYLYDLPINIGVLVEIVKPEGSTQGTELASDILKQQVATIFSQNGINPQALSINNEPPLPFFHILILFYPGQDRSTAAISGRLFEKVKLERLSFNPPGTSIAITWEKQDLIIASTTQFLEQVRQSVSNIATTFCGRVKYFEDQKFEQEYEKQNQIKLRIPPGSPLPKVEKIESEAVPPSPNGRQPMPGCENGCR